MPDTLTVPLTKTAVFKLNVTAEQSVTLDFLLSEFSKGVNFAIRKLHETRQAFKQLEKPEKGTCANSTCRAGKNAELVYYRGKSYFCKTCYNVLTHWHAVRKEYYGTPKRTVKENIKDVVRLPATMCVTCFQKAGEAYKSYLRQVRRSEFRIRRLKETRVFFEQLLDPKNRLPVSKPGERVPHFTHENKRAVVAQLQQEGKPVKTWTEAQIKRNVEDYRKRLQNQRSPRLPSFESNIVRLMAGGFTITPGEFMLSLPGKQSAIFTFRTGKPSLRLLEETHSGTRKLGQPEIIKVVRGDAEYYLHLPITREVRLRAPGTCQTILGIDLNITNNFAVCSAVPRKGGKPIDVRFWSSRRHNWKRDFYRAQRRQIQRRTDAERMKGFTADDVRERRRRMHLMVLKLRGNESRYMKYANHQISGEVVAFAKQFKAPVIVTERLTDIRQEATSALRWARDQNRRLNSWNFNQLKTFITYKALEAGIPVVEVSAKDTSKTCNKCGYQDRANRPDQATFHCQKCGYQANADFNASVNIAKRFANGEWSLVTKTMM
jgi:IS605 OrfB family transposase